MARKFLRRIWSRYSKLGRNRKKKQVWRRPKGRDNKMREKRKGYPARVSVGYRNASKSKNLVQGKVPIVINNLRDLGKIKENQIAILGNIGKKKKIEVLKKAEEKKIEIYKTNVKKFLKGAYPKGHKPQKSELGGEK